MFRLALSALALGGPSFAAAAVAGEIPIQDFAAPTFDWEVVTDQVMGGTSVRVAGLARLRSFVAGEDARGRGGGKRTEQPLSLPARFLRTS